LSSTEDRVTGFGERLRADRVAAGLTQEELAERAGLSSRAIGDLERGVTRRPRRDTVRSIARAFGQAPESRPSGRLGVPAQLPASISHFLGRAAELAKLTQLTSAGTRSSAVTIAVITGMPGVGKTALAVRWAHDVAAQFPGGQFYVNLRGYGEGQPMTPGDALAGFLRALGTEERLIPAGMTERAALYRSLIAGQRVLVLADNASQANQVRPLFPGAPGSMVVVTSRDSLAGLVALDGATRLNLDLLSLPDATRLLRILIGQRAEADPQAAKDLAVHCARLPLALRVAAEFVVARETEPLQALVTDLAESYQRQDLTDASSDPPGAMRAAFSWSMQHLDHATARFFRLLSLHPGSDLELHAVAALAGVTVQDAEGKLAVLSRAHLIYRSGIHHGGIHHGGIHRGGVGRYGMHDLLRAFAAEQVQAYETPVARRDAQARLFDYYLGMTARAIDTRFAVARRPTAISLDVWDSAARQVDDPTRAQAWLDEQRETLIKVIGYCADHGWPEQSLQLASALFRYLESGGYYSDIVSVYGNAARTAERCGDRSAQAEALNNLSVVDLRQGRYREASARLDRALALYLQAGNLTGQAYAMGNLGIVEFEVGNYARAAGRQERALKLYRQLENRPGTARTLINLGLVYLRQDCLDQATSLFRQGLEFTRQHGIRRTEAQALSNLGLACSRQGRYQEAITQLEEALVLLRQQDDAAAHAETLNNLGEALQAIGQAERARAQHEAALTMAAQIGYKSELARSHDDLGRAFQACSRPGDARRHWEKAARLYAELGAPQEAQVRACLPDPVS
jgi:tetratricopeptide (TPR) repeat protein/transcriptional regulator with XRE-family HTH domain